MYKGNTSDPDINTTGNKTNTTTSVNIPTNGVLFLSTQWGGDDDDDEDDDNKPVEYNDDEYDY